MPELPEITVLARGMQKELVGKTIKGVEVLQPKCLNLPVEAFRIALVGAQIHNVTPHGKWLKVALRQGWLLLNLGMGGEILLTNRDRLPEKVRLVFDLADGDCYGEHGRWDDSFFLVAYRERKPCPTCGTRVEKIKTGSTSSYVCPTCQPLDPEP